MSATPLTVGEWKQAVYTSMRVGDEMDMDATIDALIAAVRQEQADARPARTLDGYVRHDPDCPVQGRGPSTSCTCGLDALLSGGEK